MIFPAAINGTLDELSQHYDEITHHEGGANGYLFFAKNKVSSAEVAIKFYYGPPGDERHNEPQALASVNSPYVLPCLDARDVDDEWGYFVTKKCTEGDLDNLIETRSLSLLRALDISLSIANGCSALHQLNLIHRDLKPANIMLNQGAPQIADFGSVRKLAEQSGDVVASGHSVLYRPPESFETGRYSAQGDVYQIGIITFQLLGGTLSYDPMDYLNNLERRAFRRIADDFDRSRFVDDAIAKKAARGTLLNLSSLPPWVGPRVKTAVRRMVASEPAKRLGSMADVAAELTGARKSSLDWAWAGSDATLCVGSARYRISPGQNNHVAYLDRGLGFRKMSGIAPATVSELVQLISARHS